MQEATPENHQALQDVINHRMKVDSQMEALFGHHFQAMKDGTTPNPTYFECYRKLINQYESQCEMLDDYSLKYLKTFAAECEAIKAYPAALDATMHRLGGHHFQAMKDGTTPNPTDFECYRKLINQYESQCE